jgi:hypothetical protein
LEFFDTKVPAAFVVTIDSAKTYFTNIVSRFTEGVAMEKPHQKNDSRVTLEYLGTGHVSYFLT